MINQQKKEGWEVMWKNNGKSKRVRWIRREIENQDISDEQKAMQAKDRKGHKAKRVNGEIDILRTMARHFVKTQWT